MLAGRDAKKLCLRKKKKNILIPGAFVKQRGSFTYEKRFKR